MAPKSVPHSPKGPSLPPDEGRAQLQEAIRKGYELLKLTPLPKERYDVWRHHSADALKAACGEDSPHLYNFAGPRQVTLGPVPEQYAEEQRRKDLERRIRVLEAVVDDFPETAPVSVVQSGNVWSRLHSSVVQVSKARFETGHYADAVEAAFKDLNSRIKEHVRKATGQEFDGSDLMNRAFSLSSPVVRLADLSTEDGKNIQKGYLQIFAGAMIGIRNPKAHSNVIIDANRAIHHLHLASLLHHVFDEKL